MCECVCCTAWLSQQPKQLMAALQVKTKPLSNEPDVCPPDLRGAAKADKTQKDPRTGTDPLMAMPPLLQGTAGCFVHTPSRGSSSHLFFRVALSPLPFFHTETA